MRGDARHSKVEIMVRPPDSMARLDDLLVLGLGEVRISSGGEVTLAFDAADEEADAIARRCMANGLELLPLEVWGDDDPLEARSW